MFVQLATTTEKPLRVELVRKQSFIDGQLVMMTSIQFACLLLLFFYATLETIANRCILKTLNQRMILSIVTVVAWQTTKGTHLEKQI